MAIPDDLKMVSTNLPIRQLRVVIDAIKNEQVAWNLKKNNLVAEGFYTEFDFENSTYSYEEIFEETSALNLISADPLFVLSLINEHEVELAKVVLKRNYDKAKVVNSKITRLKKLMQPTA